MTSHLLRRLKGAINRIHGNGPSGVVRPFAGVAAAQAPEATRGPAFRERLAGVVLQRKDPPVVFSAPRLLGPAGARPACAGRDLFEPDIIVPCIAPGLTRALCSLTPGAVLGGSAIVYDPRTRVTVEESLRSWTGPVHQHPAFSAPFVPKARVLDGICLNLGTPSSSSFYHFLLEVLAKVALARPFLGDINHFLINSERSLWMEAWLVLAGVPSDRIVWMGPLSNFSCEQLLFTNFMARHTHASPSALEELRELFARTPSTGQALPRRLWISRKDASTRQLTWEDALLRQLEGFESVQLSALPPERQLELVRNAEVIAGVHGAGLALASFMRRGATVLEFQGADWPVHSLYSRLCSLCGLTHGIVRIDFAKEADLDWLKRGLKSGLPGTP